MILSCFLAALLGKLFFCLLLEGVACGSRRPLAAALYFIGSITHRVFLARCVAFLLLLVFFLDDGCGFFEDNAGGFYFRLFQGAFRLDVGHGLSLARTGTHQAVQLRILGKVVDEGNDGPTHFDQAMTGRGIVDMIHLGI